MPEPHPLHFELEGPFLEALASCAAGYHAALVRNGLTRDEATILAQGWQRSYLEALRGPHAQGAGEPPGPDRP